MIFNALLYIAEVQGQVIQDNCLLVKGTEYCACKCRMRKHIKPQQYTRFQLLHVQLRAKICIDNDFAIIVYIPQHDKHVSREFSFMNLGFVIAANV